MDISEKQTKRAVCKKTPKGEARKYYRFRADRFYGGIATADCMGCNLDCAFCWSYRSRINQDKKGEYCLPEEVAGRLAKIAHKKGFRQARISGNEPTLCKDHLLGVIENLEKEDPKILFILETNGVILGQDTGFIEKLKGFRNLHVRVSFKTGNPENFKKITARPEEWFEYQIDAVKGLYENRVPFHPAIVSEYYDENLTKRLAEISTEIARNLEFEDLKIYPWMQKRMKKRGL
ncbi:MAG: radical SAM protein [Candidatus Hydrothermarchaeales archaeon]